MKKSISNYREGYEWVDNTGNHPLLDQGQYQIGANQHLESSSGQKSENEIIGFLAQNLTSMAAITILTESPNWTVVVA